MNDAVHSGTLCGGGEGHSIAASLQTNVAQNRDELARLSSRLQKLLDSFLDGIIDRETYLAEKAKAMSNKKSLEEQISGLAAQPQNAWLEPMKNWVKTARNAGEMVVSGSSQEKRELASKVFGSNLLLDRKKSPWLRRQTLVFPPRKLVLFSNGARERT